MLSYEGKKRGSLLDRNLCVLGAGWGASSTVSKLWDSKEVVQSLNKFPPCDGVYCLQDLWRGWAR